MAGSARVWPRWALPLGGGFAAGLATASAMLQPPSSSDRTSSSTPTAAANTNANANANTNAPATSEAAAPSNRDGPVSILEAVGNTPLLELRSVSELTGCRIYAKAEFMNPCGSIKDRAARSLILDAERRGQLRPGATLVEATGGNTGVSLALLAASRGYRSLFTMPAKTAREKVELMQIMGAEVHVQPMASMFDRHTHFYHVAHRLAREGRARGLAMVFPDQFENTASMHSHYTGTGPEIWRQTHGQVDGFVASSGTGGTIAGISKYLKEQDPSCRVWLIDPEELTGTTQYVNDGRTTGQMVDGLEMIPFRGGTSVAEGIGLARVTPNFRQAQVDAGVTGSEAEVVHMAYFLLQHDGVFVGASGALNVVGAVKMAKELGPGHTIVTVLPDGGDRYRSKLYNREWLDERKLVPTATEQYSLAFVADAYRPRSEQRGEPIEPQV